MTHAAERGADPYPGQDREDYAINAQPRPAEPPELKYMRETRNAVNFIAIIVGIVATLALIGTIIAGVQLARLNHDLNSIGGGGTSNCLSQGGTNPSC